MKRQRAPHQADTKGKPWAGIPHVVLESPAYRSLGLMARAVLIELVLRFDGRNNGQIGASFDTLASRLGNTNRRAIGAAIAELVDRGFIGIEAAADRHHHKAREYRLTFVSTGGERAHCAATNDYIGWAASLSADSADVRRRPSHLAPNHGDEASLRNPVHGNASSPCKPILGDEALLRIEAARRKSAIS